MRIVLLLLAFFPAPLFAATYNIHATCFAPPCIADNDLTGAVTIEGGTVVDYWVRSGGWSFSKADAVAEYLVFRPGGKKGIEYLSLEAYSTTDPDPIGRGFAMNLADVPSGLWSQIAITNQGTCGNADCTMPTLVPSAYEGAAPIPLPAPALLLIAGLASLAWLKRARYS